MSAAKRATFRFRSLISVLIGITAIVLALTGAVLFVVPPGRVANWGGWSFLWLSKSQWQAFHLTFAAVFIAVSGLHAFFNWRPLTSYFASRRTRRLGLRWEWVLAVLVAGCIAAGTLLELPPFSTLIAAQEGLKQSWDRRDAGAPVPHAELMTIAELSEQSGVTLEEMLRSLASRGVAADPDQTLEEIAKTTSLTPRELYDMATGRQDGAARGRRGRGGGGGRAGSSGAGVERMAGAETAPDAGPGRGGGVRVPAGEGGGGPGLGRTTLESLCAREGLDLDTVLARLASAGVDATGSTTAREASDGLGIHPRDLVGALSASEVEAPSSKTVVPEAGG